MNHLSCRPQGARYMDGAPSLSPGGLASFYLNLMFSELVCFFADSEACFMDSSLMRWGAEMKVLAT
jgi:hypothetical protein